MLHLQDTEFIENILCTPQIEILTAKQRVLKMEKIKRIAIHYIGKIEKSS